MRVHFLLLFFSGLIAVGFPQQHAGSLRAVWQDASLPDSNRFAALEQLALSKGSSDSALVLFQLMEQEAIDRKVPFWEVSAIWHIANHHKNAGNFDESLSIGKKGLRRSEQIHNLVWQGNFSFLFGLIYNAQNQRDTAIQLMKSGIQLLSQTSAEEDLQDAMHDLAITFHNHSRYDSAITYHRKTLQSIRESQNEAELLRTLYGLGIAYYQLNQDDSARHYYLRHLQRAEQAGEMQAMANVLVDLGQLAVFDGDYGAAMEHYQQGLTIARTHELVKPTGWLLQSIGVVYFAQQELDQAISYFEEGLLSKEAEQDKFLQVDLLDMMGVSYKRKDSLDIALTYFQRGQAIAQEINNPFFLAKFSNRMGLIQHERENYPAAISTLSRTIDMYREIKNLDGEANCWYRIGLAEEQLGNPSRATSAYEQALTLAEPLNAKPLLARVTKELHRCYRETNQFEQALTTYDQYIALRDSLNSRKNQQATIKYEFETKALSDSLAFVREKAATDLAYERQLAQRNTFIVIGLALAALAFLIFRYRQQVRNRRREVELQRERERKEQLVELNSLKSRFFANISHELRTPLTLIMGPLSYLMDQPDAWDKAAVQEQLTLMQRNGKSLMHLIEEMLDLAKIEARQLELEETETSLHGFLKEVVDAFVLPFRQAEIDFSVQVEVPEDMRVLMDQGKMEKVLNNYLSNALKFTPVGGQVDIEIKAVNQQLTIRVQDSGPGIPPEALSHIFDRFYQTEGGAEQGGAGIGLGLVRELAHLMEGRAYVESQLGAGSTFYFEMPLHLLATQKVLAEVPKVIEDVEPIYSIGTEYTILVVEDNPDMRSFIMDLLSPQYSRVLAARNGAEGLALLEQYGQDIHLIISDIMMPEMDGLTMLQQVKAHPTWSRLPVIVLTALAAERDKLNALTIGVDDYLTKPFSTSELQVRVQNLLYHAHLRREWQQSLEVQREEKAIESASEAPEEVLDPSQAADQAWIQELQQIIESSLPQQKWKVDSLAEAAHLSPRQLQRRIKGITGLSPAKFIKEVQLQKARRKLEDGKVISLSEVAYACGFDHQGNFSTSFKARFGKSPREYVRSGVG
ncbi:MAG: tetratricopeptide repeat protein [Bacteroidota bacterium]